MILHLGRSMCIQCVAAHHRSLAVAAAFTAGVYVGAVGGASGDVRDPLRRIAGVDAFPVAGPARYRIGEASRLGAQCLFPGRGSRCAQC